MGYRCQAFRNEAKIFLPTASALLLARRFPSQRATRPVVRSFHRSWPRRPSVLRLSKILGILCGCWEEGVFGQALFVKHGRSGTGRSSALRGSGGCPGSAASSICSRTPSPTFLASTSAKPLAYASARSSTPRTRRRPSVCSSRLSRRGRKMPRNWPNGPRPIWPTDSPPSISRRLIASACEPPTASNASTAKSSAELVQLRSFPTPHRACA